MNSICPIYRTAVSVLSRNVFKTCALSSNRELQSFTAAQKNPLTGIQKSIQNNGQQLPFIPSLTPLSIPVRHAGVYNSRNASELWSAATGTSNAGMKKGRGRARKSRIKDLNRGQVIGVGDVNMVWPGLNSPAVKGQSIVRREMLPQNEKRTEALQDIRTSRKRMKLSPLERGWSGNKMAGRSCGAPDPNGYDTFEDFDTIVLEMKRVTVMTGTLGRRRRTSVFSVTGNGNGVVGFALAKSLNPNIAVRKAKNKAVKQLHHIDRYEDNTVLHDFNTDFGLTRIFVRKAPEGTGLQCHRAIAAICKVAGIKDIHVKVDRCSSNVQNVTKAFLLGLLRQKKYSTLAAEKGLHLVEMREEHCHYPRVLASPPVVRKPEDVDTTESMDLRMHVMDGRIPLWKKNPAPFWTRSEGYEYYFKNKWRVARIQEPIKYDLMKEYGFLRSHLFDQFPECHAVWWTDPANAREEEESDF